MLKASGQDNPHLLQQYPFINYDADTLQLANPKSSLSHFFSELNNLTRTGIGTINIMQIGGSHIQADVWSHQVRKRFQSDLGLNAGRGFLFPYKLAKTNNPSYYNVTYSGEWSGYRNAVLKHQKTWGLSGVTAVTTDSVSSFKIEFKPDEIPSYDFNQVKVFHDTDSSGFCIDITTDSCYSIYPNHELGFTEFKFTSFQKQIEFRIFKTDSFQSHFNLYGISLENDDNGITYTSVGVNGASTSSYLRNQLFNQHLLTIQPNLVIFCIGINDAFEPGFCAKCFENNYDSLVSKIKEVSPDCNFLFVSNTDSYYKRRYPNKRIAEVQQAMQNLMYKHNAAYWDLATVMGGLGSIKTWNKNNLAQRDLIHFTKSGYELIGDLMFSALIKAYSSYLHNNTNQIHHEN